ncbi:ThiF family adenylyltransferase [Alkalicoccus luteus]|uniref:ThiF family adenylyltransferase n=1 Tax=Alkalicoccus luteus TaxID=1237094 RepID=UPI0040335CFA
MERYARQMRVPGFGGSAQKQIQDSHVLIAGVGALGSSIAESLCRAGVGRLSLIDRDIVELTNLQRQQLYTEWDVEQSRPKAEAALERLQQVNSSVQVEAYTAELTPAVVESFQDVSLIMDGLDNFETRLLLNDFALKHRIPLIYGGALADRCMSYTVLPGEEAPCLRCLFGESDQETESCETAGVLGPAVQITAGLQTAEALKLLSGQPEKRRNGLLQAELIDFSVRTFQVSQMKQESCSSCGNSPTYPALSRMENGLAVMTLCGRNTVQVRPVGLSYQLRRSVREAKAVREVGAFTELLIKDRRMMVFADGRALIHGTADKQEAERLYHVCMERQTLTQEIE